MAKFRIEYLVKNEVLKAFTIQAGNEAEAWQWAEVQQKAMEKTFDDGRGAFSSNPGKWKPKIIEIAEAPKAPEPAPDKKAKKKAA
jgi:hypothetical protein